MESITIKETKYLLNLEMFYENGHPKIHYTIDENEASMMDIGLVLYKLRQIEQELIDRQWLGDGFDIIGNGGDDYGNEEEED